MGLFSKGVIFLQQEQITILYTSDIHGHILPINYGNNKPEDIGLVKYATIVKQARQAKKNLIVLDNGDLIQGTPLMTNFVKNYSYRENPTIGIMNQLNIDAGVLGNHEFNFGKDIISSAVGQAEYPILSANILDSETEKPAFGPPYITKQFSNGIRLAIIGVTTHYIPNWESPEHIKGLKFADALETLKKWAAYVKVNEAPDVIIASYHGGFEADLETGTPTEIYTGENQGYKMCMEIPEIDVLLTGHQHRKLTGFINDVLVIQPGNNGTHYGEVSLQLTKNAEGKWQIANKEASLHNLEQVENDDEVLHYINPLEKATQAWLDEPIGYINGDMTITDPLEARIKKHPFIQFIQNVQMEASGADISVTSLLNNNSLGFTSTVTMRDVVSNYMYPNTLVVLELSGKDIIKALEQTAQYFTLTDAGEITVNPVYIEPKPQHYNYDMWEGIEYTFNISKPMGERVEHVTYHGEPLMDDNTYKVVLNNYRASGGGDYAMFQGKKVVKEIQKDAVELIQEYFEKYHIVEAKTVDNFKVIK